MALTTLVEVVDGGFRFVLKKNQWPDVEVSIWGYVADSVQVNGIYEFWSELFSCLSNFQGCAPRP